jgi:hypothetical protein
MWMSHQTLRRLSKADLTELSLSPLLLAGLLHVPFYIMKLPGMEWKQL